MQWRDEAKRSNALATQNKALQGFGNADLDKALLRHGTTMHDRPRQGRSRALLGQGVA